MLKTLWDWLWKPSERTWKLRQMQEEVLSLRLEWDEVLDKLMAREDRERKRHMKALRDRQSDEQGEPRGEVASTKDDLRAKLKAIRGGT